MSQDLMQYIKDMHARGYSTSQIRGAMLKQYPPAYVDALIDKLEKPESDFSFSSVPAPEKDDPQDEEESDDIEEDKPKFIEKILGILFSPKQLFARLKKEDMISAFKLYALYVLVLGVILFVITLFGASQIIPFIGNMGSSLILIQLIYFGIMILWMLFLPFSIVAYYYLFLKLVFKMKKGYDQCYKAIVYPMLQIMIFYALLIPLALILSIFSNILTAVVVIVLTIAIIIYNLVTQIYGLSTLCDVEPYKAAIVVLLPIALVLLVFLVGFLFLGSIFSSLMTGGMPGLGGAPQIPILPIT